MVPCAYLRVFQPLEAFPDHERAHWERFIIGGGGPPRARPVYRQRATPERLGVLASADGDFADIRVVGGQYFICPWRTRLRVLASLLSFREAAPFDLSEALIPDDEARRAAKELARMRRRNPRAISFIMQSPWHVPVRWFVLFRDDERRIGDEDGRHRLFYVTATHKAIRRAMRAGPVLRHADLGPVADVLDELAEWLEAFDPRSLVELDYGGLCDLLTWDELDDDHSARDIQEALDALSSGELPRSAELYESVLGRWADVRNHESMN